MNEIDTVLFVAVFALMSALGWYFTYKMWKAIDRFVVDSRNLNNINRLRAFWLLVAFSAMASFALATTLSLLLSTGRAERFYSLFLPIEIVSFGCGLLATLAVTLSASVSRTLLRWDRKRRGLDTIS